VGVRPGEARPGEWIRQRRVAAGLTREDMSERSGVSVRAIADLERGRTRHPYPSSVLALARALGLPDGAGAELVARYRAGGDDAAAQARCLRTIELCRYDLAMALDHLGDTYASAGDVADASEAWRESADLFERLRHPAADQVRDKLAALPTALPSAGMPGG
jgi:transcriptional regulator with XRE-family HTH domain